MTDLQPAEPRADEAQGPPGPHPHRWRILSVSLVIGFMTLLDVTIVNVALPSIRQGLGASTSGVQWIVSGYALTFGLTLVAGGRLGDAFGRRRMMLLGLVGFIVTSAAVGLAPGEGTVVGARLLQGVAAGMLTPQNAGLIQQLFTGAERGRAFGLFGFVVSISAGTGPVIGGLIISLLGTDLGWRAIFLVNVPIGMVALVFVVRLVPRREPRTDGGRERIDVVGALLLGGAVLAVLLPLVQLMNGPSPVLLVLLTAPALGWAFHRWERRTVARGRAPLLDVALLRRTPGYASGIALGSLYFTGFSGVFLVLSVYLQDGLDYSPLVAGLLLTPFALGSTITAPLAGRWVSTFGRKVTVVALVVVMVGMGGVALAAPATTSGGSDGAAWQLALLVAPLLLLAGLGGGGVVSPNITLTLADVPPRMGGAAGGALQTGQRIGSALGAALVVTVYQVTLGGSADVGRALQAALGTALVVIFAAFVLAVRDLRLDAGRDLS